MSHPITPSDQLKSLEPKIYIYDKKIEELKRELKFLEYKRKLLTNHFLKIRAKILCEKIAENLQELLQK